MEFTHDYVKECFTYNPEEGILRWNEDRPAYHYKKPAYYTRWKNMYAGKPVGSKSKDGYLITKLLGTTYCVTHLIWMYMTGELPKHEIDHADNDRGNNKWANLQDLSRRDNLGRRGGFRQLSTTSVKYICERLMQGLPYQHIAREFDCTANSVRQIYLKTTYRDISVGYDFPAR